MARENQIVVESPIVINFEVRVPLRPGENQDVTGVHLANGFRRTDHQRLEFGVQLLLVFEIVGDRLVHQVIAEDRGFIRITGRNAAPDGDEPFLHLRTAEQPRITVRIVDVVAGLPARTVVHIENQPQPGVTTPLYNAVHEGKSLLGIMQPEILLPGEELVMERQPHGRSSGRSDVIDIFACDVILAKRTPETLHIGRADQLAQPFMDAVRRIGALGKLKEVSLRIEPMPEVRAPDFEALPVSVDQIHTVGTYEIRRPVSPVGACRAAQHGKREGEVFENSSHYFVL